jgi:hypothetical protein
MGDMTWVEYYDTDLVVGDGRAGFVRHRLDTDSAMCDMTWVECYDTDLVVGDGRAGFVRH